jgi:hypothetical protein
VPSTSFLEAQKTWMPAPSAGMTEGECELLHVRAGTALVLWRGHRAIGDDGRCPTIARLGVSSLDLASSGSTGGALFLARQTSARSRVGSARAANSVCSPPPCGEGMGGGGPSADHRTTPTPALRADPPHKGEGRTECAARKGFWRKQNAVQKKRAPTWPARRHFGSGELVSRAGSARRAPSSSASGFRR